MTEPDLATASAAFAPPTAGATLRAAREAAGLTLDAVAQQLKLAPRQVQALESDNFAGLPGRTFVRGFVRNYARCVGLDPDAVVALLPAGDQAAALHRPSLQPTPRAIGELPSDAPRTRIWSRVAIPLALVAIVGVAAVYEFTRQQADSRRAASEAAAKVSATPSSTSVALPNPLTETEKATPASTPASADGTANVAAAPAASVTDAPPVSAPAMALASPAAQPPAPAAATPAAAAEDATAALVFTFRGSSWIEVKDKTGAVVLSLIGARGTTQSAAGSPPFDVVVGNAPEVGVMFRGEPVDLSRYTKQNVARFTLR